MSENAPTIEAIPDWQADLASGDIVLFRYPVADPQNTDAQPKSRPCLVLSTQKFIGKRFATIAYGTSIRSRANRGYEVIVKDPVAQHTAGLDKPTYFIGSRRLIVCLDHPLFDLSGPHGTPVIGHLDGSLQDRLATVVSHMRSVTAQRIGILS